MNMPSVPNAPTPEITDNQPTSTPIGNDDKVPKVITPNRLILNVRQLRTSTLEYPVIYPYGSYAGTPTTYIELTMFPENDTTSMTVNELHDAITFQGVQSRTLVFRFSLAGFTVRTLDSLFWLFAAQGYHIITETISEFPYSDYNGLVEKRIVILDPSNNRNDVPSPIVFANTVFLSRNKHLIEPIIHIHNTQSLDYAAQLVKCFGAEPITIYLVPHATLSGETDGLAGFIRSYAMLMGIVANDQRFQQYSVRVSVNTGVLFTGDY